MRSAALKTLQIFALSSLASTVACAGNKASTETPAGLSQEEIDAQREKVVQAAKVQGLVGLANGDLDNGRYVSALRRADEALADNPDNPDAYVVKGAAYWRAGQPAESTEAYEKAVELDPKNFAAIQGLGRNLQATGQHARALELQDQLIAAESDGFSIRPCVDGGCEEGICDAGSNMCKPPMEVAPRLLKLWSQYLLLDIEGATNTVDEIFLSVGADEITLDLVQRYAAFVKALSGREGLLDVEGTVGSSDLALDVAGGIKHMSAIVGEEYARTIVLELQDECRVHPDLVAALGLEAVANIKPVGIDAETPLVILPEVTIGDLKIKNVPALVQDLSSFEASIGEVPSLVLGRQVLQRFGAVEFDFPGGNVNFHVEAPARGPEVQELPLVMLDLHVLHVPAVPVSIDGNDHSFWAWLGGSWGSVLALTSKAYLKSAHRPSEIDPPDDEELGLKMVFLDSLHVGEKSLPGGGGLVFTNTPPEATLAKVTEVTRFELGGYLNVARVRNWKVSYHLQEGKVSLAFPAHEGGEDEPDA